MSLQTLAEQTIVQTASLGRNHGDSVREKRLGTSANYPAPTKIFLMYLRFDRDSCLHVSHYFDDLGRRSVEQAEEDLTREARPSHPGAKTHRVSQNFEAMNFNEACYFTIVLDEARWEFYNDPDVPDNPPLVFLERKPGDPPGTVYAPNHSFYDAKSVQVKDVDRPALRCINFCKADAAGTGLPNGATTNFCFEINLRAPFALMGSQRFITVIIDPTGENKGPTR